MIRLLLAIFSTIIEVMLYILLKINNFNVIRFLVYKDIKKEGKLNEKQKPGL